MVLAISAKILQLGQGNPVCVYKLGNERLELEEATWGSWLMVCRA